ncbi:MAG TPA: hypothetical protein VD997_02905 [Phycisphaerales bacterium]|nr:hypothetical protein [Phycisphaerales bacterium]
MVRWTLTASGLLLLAGVLAGCEAAPARQSDAALPKTGDQGPNTSLEALAEGSGGTPILNVPDPHAPPRGDLAREAELAAINLEKLLASGVLDRARQGDASSGTPTSEPEAYAFEPPEEFVGPIAEVVPPPEPEPEPFDQTLDLAQRIAKLLREPGEGRRKIPDAVALGPIEALEPGILADLEDPDNRIGPKLSTEDREALIGARDAILANPAGANEALVKALSKLAPPPTLKIARAALCSRVTGFGHYDPLPTSTFVFGRPIRVIVYVELDGFTARPAREGDVALSGASLGELVTVDLSQALSLYADPSGLLSWHRPARAVVETSRNKRRDFYVIQQIELPATLSIGRYNLKVTVKDRTSGSEAEAVLPISVVADRSAQR